MCANARVRGEIWEKQFSRVLPHDLHWEYKPYKLKRSFTKFNLRTCSWKKECIRAFHVSFNFFTFYKRDSQDQWNFAPSDEMAPSDSCESSCKHLSPASVGFVDCEPSYNRPRKTLPRSFYPQCCAMYFMKRRCNTSEFSILGTVARFPCFSKVPPSTWPGRPLYVCPVRIQDWGFII